MNHILVAPQAIVYQTVEVGHGTIVEPWVVLGRPIESHLRNVRQSDNPATFEQLYQAPRIETSIGSDAIIRSGAVVYANSVIGRAVEIGHHSVIREGCEIGDYTCILPHTSIRKNVTIEKGCRIGGVVGDNSSLGCYVTCLGQLVHDYTVGIGGEIEPGPALDAGSVVGRGAIIVGSVQIGEFAFVSAGAVVRRDVEPRTIVAGNPARVVGKRQDDDIGRVMMRIERGTYL